MCDYNAVELSSLHGWKGHWKWLRACTIEKETIRVSSNPSLRSPHLLCRSLHGAAEPSRPIEIEVAGVWKGAIFVGEENDIVPENDEQVADFLAMSTIDCALVSVDTGIAPERQKRPFAQSSQIALGVGHSLLFLDNRRRRGWMLVRMACHRHQPG